MSNTSKVIIVYIIGLIFIKKMNYFNVLSCSILGSCLFFLITNFGVWIVGYPKTLDGFILCLLLIAISLDPFRLTPEHTLIISAGLNPLLQTNLMVIHPPLIFAFYHSLLKKYFRDVFL